MKFCRLTKEMDFFGKNPELYIEGREKQITHVGKILTYLFIILYIIIFCYKVYRMTTRVDITFYDSFSNTDEIPTVKIVQDNFTLVFGMRNEYGMPFIDDTIYYPVAFFFNQGIYEEIDIEICSEDKLSQEFLEYLGDDGVDNYFCLKHIDFELRPFMNSIRFEIYPCVDLYEGEGYCKSREFIDEYLNNLLFMIYFEDVNLTPLNFNNPVKKKISSVNTEIFRDLGQYLYSEMQVVRIETSTNMIGFDFFTEPKIENFIKYDKGIILSYPGYNVLDENNTYPSTIFELQLNDRILLEKRKYVQLIDVLGEIGGFMEIIHSLFILICSIFVEMIYEKRITNSLFSFDIKKRLILFKNQKNYSFKNNEEIKLEEINIYNPNISPINNNKNKIKEKKMIIKSNFNNINNNINETDFAQKNNASDIKSSRKEIKLENIEMQSIKKNYEDINKNSIEYLNNLTKKNEEDKEKDWIINKINLRQLIISKCSCCKKNKNKVYGIVLSESMKLIIEKLDISNIFRNIWYIENSNNIVNKNLDAIKISGEYEKVLIDIAKT